jgi:hypothetical protein
MYSIHSLVNDFPLQFGASDWIRHTQTSEINPGYSQEIGEVLVLIGTSYRRTQSERAKQVFYLHRQYHRVALRQDVRLEERMTLDD